MSKGQTRQRRLGKNLSNAEKIARRTEAVKRIHQLLARCPLSAVDLARVLGINSNTVYGYLRYMADMGEVRRNGEVDADRRDKWELGPADPAKLAVHEVRSHGATIVAARQIGMWRDPLDVAFFGPARCPAA